MSSITAQTSDVGARLREASGLVRLATTVHVGEGVASTTLAFRTPADVDAGRVPDQAFFMHVDGGRYEWEVHRGSDVVRGGAPFLRPFNQRLAAGLAEAVFRTTAITTHSVAEPMGTPSGRIRRSSGEFAPLTPTLGLHLDRMLTVAQQVLSTPELYASDLVRESTVVGVIDAAIAAYGLLDPADGTRRTPNLVRRAVRYLWEHHSEPVRVEEVAAAAHVSVRGLQGAFQREYGHSPTAELRKVRLRSARQALLAADVSESTVSRIARESGFVNLGRFAADYRTEFGELPSETLRPR